MSELIQIITGMLGTLGFAIVFGSKKEHLPILAIGGGISWAVYVLSAMVLSSEPACYFIAAAAAALYAEIFARILRTPTTGILIPASLPLVPGGALYYTMRFAISGDWQSFFERGGATLAIALAIAMGIITVSTVMKLVLSVSLSKK